MANVQVRGVPEDVHRTLTPRAALAGQSLNEFLVERIRAPEAYSGPSSAGLVREQRETR